MNYLFFLALGFLLAIMFLVIMEYFKRAKASASLEKLAEKTGGFLTYGWLGAKLAGSLDGNSFTITCLPRRNGYLIFPKPARLSVSLIHNIPGQFYIAHKGSVEFPDFLANKYPPVESGNALFDKEFSIHSPYPSFIRENFKDGEKRQAIRRLFTMGARSINFDGKAISVIWEPQKPADVIDEDFLRETAARLFSIMKNLQKSGAFMEEAKTDMFSIALAFLAIFLATVVLSFILIYNV